MAHFLENAKESYHIMIVDYDRTPDKCPIF